MFTFGRERELQASARYVRGAENQRLAAATVNAVHDFIERKENAESAIEVIAISFIEGGSGVWEQAASWLRKLSAELDNTTLWFELANHSSSRVRYRVACCLADIPSDARNVIGQKLSADRSSKVSQMAEARLEENET